MACPIRILTGIALLLNHGVKVDFFDKDLSEQVQEANRGFIEYYEHRREVHPGSQPPSYQVSLRRPERRPFRGPLLEELQPEPRAGLEDFDVERIEQYLTALGERGRYRVPSPGLWRFFETARFVVRSAERKRQVPTVAGLVLFGTKPDHYLPHCKIKATCFTGTPEEGALLENVAPDGKEDITGPLPRMVERAEEFFERHVVKVPRIEGFRTIEGAEYPKRVIREAVINALIHRDYRGGRDVFFRMFRDRIAVESPGYPPEPLMLEDFQSYDVKPLRRNPHIAKAAHQMRYMDEEAFGIRSMPVRLREYGLREPGFAYHLDFFVVTFYGRQWSPAHLLVKDDVLEKLSSRQREILDVAKQAGITSEDCRRLFGVTRETANQDFRKLMELGLIERVGSGRATRYRFRGR